MRTAWGDSEDDALNALPYRDQVIYLRGILRRMDYQTGISGTRFRISYDWLRWICEVHPERGSKEAVVVVTKAQVIASLHRLQRRGLIEWIKQPKGHVGLIFRCILAKWDSSASVRNDTTTTFQKPVTARVRARKYSYEPHNTVNRITPPYQDKDISTVLPRTTIGGNFP